jgi:hypothetical protein
VVNRRKPRAQTSVVSRYPAPAPIDDFVLLFLPPCGPYLTPLATGSLELSQLVSPLLRGPARHRPFTPALHPHQCKSSRTPAIIDQESVHTMLLITHHNQERPSTGPRMLRSSAAEPSPSPREDDVGFAAKNSPPEAGEGAAKQGKRGTPHLTPSTTSAVRSSPYSCS